MSYEVIYIREELEKQADKLAMNSSMKTSGREAWRRIKNGELEGTLLASKLAGIFFLLGEE
jgi:hypothetical protein